MRLFSIILMIAFVLQSCLSVSRKGAKNSVPPRGNIPTLPHGALERNKLDTTFDYDVLHNNIIYLKLPDNILKGKVYEGVEFSVLIDQSKTIQGIELIECSLYNKKNAVYKFPGVLKDQQELQLKLQQFLLKCMPGIEFKQTKEPKVGIHKTYCFANLYK